MLTFIKNQIIRQFRNKRVRRLAVSWRQSRERRLTSLPIVTFPLISETNVFKAFGLSCGADIIFSCFCYSCQENNHDLVYEPVSNFMREAVKDHIENINLDSEHVVRISSSLSLSSNQELLTEAVAPDKLKTKLSQVESPDDLEYYIDPMISLINRKHDCYVRANQLPNPVIGASGQTYDQALGHADLIPNYTVEALIANWCESNSIKLPDPEKSMTLKQPSGFAGSDGKEPSLEEQRSCSLGHLPNQSKAECSNGRKELQGHNRTSSASSAVSSTECLRGEDDRVSQSSSDMANCGTDVSGEMAQEAPASSTSQREQESQSRLPEPRSRNQTIWRRPSERFVPRIVSSPSLDSRPDLSEVEAAVRRLIEDLKSDSTEMQRSATHELRLLAKHNMENRIIIANCGAIIHLVGLLHSTDSKTQENAVTALLNLSINDNNKIAIANADAIDPLSQVLETGNPEAKENSAATIFSLSVIEENKVKIGRSGAIKPLVELLGNGTPRGKKDAATALFNLSIFHENKARIVQAGAVRHLVELMDPAAGMVDKAVAVLANLTTIHEGRLAIGYEGVASQLLWKSSSWDLLEGKRMQLQLCTNSNKFCTLVLQEGLWRSLGHPEQGKRFAQLLLTHFRNQRHGGGRS
ncbi:unnamed protein product [Spirodela intermedia]|uniref:RING-type E3 ubiquitin transferase n=1 Tax=Spirodela intermedia TaxID=51605 RepID=A0A7I8LF15_SPIIN|nr:unnamed protein product [Spirodela intermedia]